VQKLNDIGIGTNKKMEIMNSLEVKNSFCTDSRWLQYTGTQLNFSFAQNS
jgi:hypothetical protein